MLLLADTQIKGAFKGCNGHRVYRLNNGQVWKESHYKYYYHYAYSPRAKLWQDGSTYYLEVDGMPEKIEVRKATSSDVEEVEREDD